MATERSDNQDEVAIKTSSVRLCAIPGWRLSSSKHIGKEFNFKGTECQTDKLGHATKSTEKKTSTQIRYKSALPLVKCIPHHTNKHYGS